ncbi:MAG TPA: CoA transferase, partial [Dehalococcoidia bacterium]|nr:CoA transferase [Dehalococcoidia bacterium]
MPESARTGATGPLHGYRVVDLTTARGEMAGRLLADLGAEVIKVEPPAGCESRRLPPFAGDDLADSLFWASVALGKRSVVLDLESEVDRDQLLALIRTADVLIESFDPGTLAPLGLDYPTLSQLQPALIYTSITPFGQTGPEAGSPASELTVEAAGGLISMQGDPDRPPIPVGYPQAGFHAGAQAAADTTIALHERLRSGLGQHLDVSMQAAMVWTLMNATGYPPNHHDDPPVGGSHRGAPVLEVFPGLRIPGMWLCADGYLAYAITLPGLGGRTHGRVMQWAEEEGSLPDSLHGIDWSNWIADVVAETLPVERVIESVAVL